MNATKLLTTTVAALTVVGAGLVFAQSTPGTPPPMTSTEPANQAQPATPPATTTTPSQDTTQRSDVPMTTDAQADRN